MSRVRMESTWKSKQKWGLRRPEYVLLKCLLKRFLHSIGFRRQKLSSTSIESASCLCGALHRFKAATTSRLGSSWIQVRSVRVEWQAPHTTSATMADLALWQRVKTSAALPLALPLLGWAPEAPTNLSSPPSLYCKNANKARMLRDPENYYWNCINEYSSFTNIKERWCVQI